MTRMKMKRWEAEWTKESRPLPYHLVSDPLRLEPAYICKPSFTGSDWQINPKWTIRIANIIDKY
jgi:hypothetical protein